VLALAGYKLGQHWRDVGKALHDYDIVIGVVIVLLVALFLYRHLRRSERAQEQEGDVPRTSQS
jgi:membrane protein DedA with SNARE-associated domain